MPQLDTIYILMTYAWTWSMLYMISQKIKMVIMTKTPQLTTLNKKTPTLPWL